MELNSKTFRTVIPLMVVGALASACAPTQSTIAAKDTYTAKAHSGSVGTSFTEPALAVAVPKEGTAFYPATGESFGQERATLIPPMQTAPKYALATKLSGVTPVSAENTALIQYGAEPDRGYQPGRSHSEERDGQSSSNDRDSFDGVDVASADDSGASEVETGGGSSGGGSYTTTSY